MPTRVVTNFGARTFVHRELVRVLLVAGVWMTATSAVAQYRTPEWRNFHNSTYVGEESESARVALFRAEEHLQAERPLEAGRELLALLHSDARGLVRYGERLVLPLERAVALRLSGLPATALQELRDEERTLSERSFRDVNLWTGAKQRLELALRHPLSEVADQQLYQLGQQALLAGDARWAASIFEGLVHWPSARTGEFRKLAAGRLLQALAQIGESPGQGPLLSWPEGIVTSADGPTNLSVLRDRATQSPDHDAATWDTLLGDVSRSRLPAVSAQPPTPVFTFNGEFANDRRTEFAIQRRRFQTPRPSPVPPFPSGLPLVIGSRLVTMDAGAIHVRDLATGQDEFAPLRTDFDLHIDPERYLVVEDGLAASVTDEMLYVTVEVVDVRSMERDRFGALYGIDLRREGYVQFGVRSWDYARDDPRYGWVYSGPAQKVSGRLLVPASRLDVKETHCHLLSFDPATGEQNGDRFVARASAVARYADRFSAEAPRLVQAAPIAVCRGDVYVCSNLGVVAAIRAGDLGVQWVFRYNRMVPVNSRRYVRQVFFDTRGWSSRAPVVWPDRVFVTPSDSVYLYALARWPNGAGDLILNDPIEQEARQAWIGVDRRALYFLVQKSQGHAVQATDPSGGILWETPPLPADEPVVGVPAMTDRFMFVPTDRRIYRMDLAKGGFYDRVIAPPAEVGVPIPRFGAFGDLVVTDNWLISQSWSFVHVYRVTP